MDGTPGAECDYLKPLRIILDPGHGNLPGALPRDPGAVGNGTTESAANLAIALACKYVLSEAGHVAKLTRRDERRPDWTARTNGMGLADLYLSIHHDMAQGGRSMAYYAAGRDYHSGPNPAKSRAFAACLEQATPDPEFSVLPDNSSRHGRLYIRSALAPVAVMWEVDPTRIHTRPERIQRAEQLLYAINLAQREGTLPGLRA